MIPILYEASEKEFKTNGLGRLPDMISCVVTEERNTAGGYTLEAEYPCDGENFDLIRVHRIIYAQANDNGAQPFDIYNIVKSLDSRTVTIYANHISMRLLGIPFVETSSTFTGASALLTAIPNNVPFDGNKGDSSSDRIHVDFTFSTDIADSHVYKVQETKAVYNMLLGSEGSILEGSGGEYEFDKLNVILHSARGEDNGVSVRYGKNLINLEYDEDSTEHFNGHLPFWTDGDDYNRANRAYYSTDVRPYPYIEVYDASDRYDSKPTGSVLINLGKSLSGKGQESDISISVEMAALWQTEEYKDFEQLERVCLCDTVRIYDSYDDVYATAKVVKTVYNTLADRYDEIGIGSIKPTLIDSLIKLK